MHFNIINKRNNPKYPMETVKLCYNSLIVSGYIKRNGAKKKKMKKIDGILNSEKYITLLRFHVLSDILEGKIFQYGADLSYIIT